MAAIYKALPNLEAYHLQIILSNFKFPELCRLLNDQADFEKYLDSMINGARVCNEMVYALNELRKKAFEEKEESYDPIKGISDVYDILSDGEKERACGSLLDKQKFFMDSYSEIMKRLNSALRVQKDGEEGACRN